jgi:A/G-specific adenine glycosylase
MSGTLGVSLLKWYDKHQRDLPWRKTRDPYKIWISEVMLQQTQVQTVLAYYREWMRRFPTVEALAKAPEGEVLRAWQGLGYYRRAKNLHRAARQILVEYNGVFPSDIAILRKLPGVGAYSAGAVASIAFNQSVPAVDVNVLRVAARILLLRGDPTQPAAKDIITREVQRWIPRGRARWFNQALMELGAMICVSGQPLCLLCPISGFCKAYQEGVQDAIPPKAEPKKKEKITVVAGVLKDLRGRVLIQKRPNKGLMANLWEFPGGKVELGERLAQALQREWTEELGLRITAGREIMAIRHGYTRFNVHLHVFECEKSSGRPKALWAQEIRWVPVRDLERFAFPSANVRIVRWLLARAGSANGPAKSLA